MSFRARLALVAAAAVGLAVVAASAVTFVLVRNELRDQVDATLQSRAFEIAGAVHPQTGPDGVYLDAGPRGFSVYVQEIFANGTVLRTRGEGVLPVTHRALETARGNQSEPYFSDAHVDDRRVRVLTIPAPGYVLQVADITDVDQTLHKVGIALLLIALGGMAVAPSLSIGTQSRRNDGWSCAPGPWDFGPDRMKMRSGSAENDE